MGKSKVAVVTYYGVDGACAAAMLLLKYPDAAVIVSSANRIGESFQALEEEAYTQIHVCGVGVGCEWSTLAQAAQAVKKRGARITWYCGRGYLEQLAGAFKAFCEPVFLEEGTNTGAVAQYLGLGERCDAHLLVDLSWCDRYVKNARKRPDFTAEQSEWVDFVEAATSHYFKYQDQETYVTLVRKLASLTLGPRDRVLIETFRRTGYQYVLHGASPTMRKVKQRIQKCAQANRNVIITGESGVGKEHVAHLLWEGSAQAQGPFIPVNCATYAGNSSLANSDLFGHTKGAFTGATGSRKGRFIEADMGILFLDELGELPLEVQAKLLRVIEDGWVTPEGADRPERRVNVRIVTATNRDLPSMVRSGGFRADLYHRISALHIWVPPLRDRPEDIDAIASERLVLLQKEGYKAKLSRADLKELHSYDWPGNVRQLIKVFERAVLLGTSLAEAIEEERALGEVVQYGSERTRQSDTLFPVDRDHIRPMKEVQSLYARNVWELCGQNFSAAARALGVNPNTLRYTYLAEAESGSAG